MLKRAYIIITDWKRPLVRVLESCSVLFSVRGRDIKGKILYTNGHVPIVIDELELTKNTKTELKNLKQTKVKDAIKSLSKLYNKTISFGLFGIDKIYVSEHINYTITKIDVAKHNNYLKSIKGKEYQNHFLVPCKNIEIFNLATKSWDKVANIGVVE